jgi:hypothetical protein
MEDYKTLILLFKIPFGTQKDFFEIYRQFGHMSSESFTSLALEEWQIFRSSHYSEWFCGLLFTQWFRQAQQTYSTMVPAVEVQKAQHFAPAVWLYHTRAHSSSVTTVLLFCLITGQEE